MGSMNNMTFSEIVTPHIAGLEGRCRLVSGSNAVEWEKLTETVVFLHATWSSPSVKSLKTDLAEFATHNSSRPVEFLIVNVDELKEEFYEGLPGTFGGNGETFFVRDGEVVGHLSHYSEDFASKLRKAFPQ